MYQYIFSPWFADGPFSEVRVSAIRVHMREPWEAYRNYSHLLGIDTKLTRIPKHLWSSRRPRESLLRAERLITFCDVAGCLPLDRSRKSRDHLLVKTIAHCDHTTYFADPYGAPLILTEPYSPTRGEIEEELRVKELTAIVLPYPGIYAGGKNWTTSVLMGLPEQEGLLSEIEERLVSADVEKAVTVKEMSFEEALMLSKQQAREVSYV